MIICIYVSNVISFCFVSTSEHSKKNQINLTYWNSQVVKLEAKPIFANVFFQTLCTSHPQYFFFFDRWAFWLIIWLMMMMMKVFVYWDFVPVTTIVYLRSISRAIIAADRLFFITPNVIYQSLHQRNVHQTEVNLIGILFFFFGYLITQFQGFWKEQKYETPVWNESNFLPHF